MEKPVLAMAANSSSMVSPSFRALIVINMQQERGFWEVYGLGTILGNTCNLLFTNGIY